jgi:hypothetical protein
VALEFDYWLWIICISLPIAYDLMLLKKGRYFGIDRLADAEN